MLKASYEEAKRLLLEHRSTLDKIAAFLIEKETITGKQFMEIFYEVEGIDPETKEKRKEERIAMNPVEGISMNPETEETAEAAETVEDAESGKEL